MCHREYIWSTILFIYSLLIPLLKKENIYFSSEVQEILLLCALITWILVDLIAWMVFLNCWLNPTHFFSRVIVAFMDAVVF